MTRQKGQTSRDSYQIRDIKVKELEYINLIVLSKLRSKLKLSITFSYSRFRNKDNTEICTRERDIKDVHRDLLKIFRVITSKLVRYTDLEVAAIDISNQIKVSNKNYYKVLDLIYRAYKLQEPNGRMYFDTNELGQKELDGIDFRERGKKRRESNTYFKIYNKRKEQQATNKETKGMMWRGELTLKGRALKYHKLNTLESITSDNLSKVLNSTIGQTLKTLIQQQLTQDIKDLKEDATKCGTKKIRERILMNSHKLFDVSILDVLVVPKIIGVKERMCREHKKNIKELLNKQQQQGEIKQDFTGNIAKLKKLLKEIAKIELEIEITEEGANVWEKQD